MQINPNRQELTSKVGLAEFADWHQFNWLSVLYIQVTKTWLQICPTKRGSMSKVWRGDFTVWWEELAASIGLHNPQYTTCKGTESFLDDYCSFVELCLITPHLANPCFYWWTWWAPKQDPGGYKHAEKLPCLSHMYNMCITCVMALAVTKIVTTSTPPSTVRGPEPNTAYFSTLKKWMFHKSETGNHLHDYWFGACSFDMM